MEESSRRRESHDVIMAEWSERYNVADFEAAGRDHYPRPVDNL